MIPVRVVAARSPRREHRLDGRILERRREREDPSGVEIAVGIPVEPASDALLNGVVDVGMAKRARDSDPLDRPVLDLRLQSHDGVELEERAFTVEEAYAAREAFITSATQTVMPVVRLDGRPIADGKPGPVAQRLRLKFHQIAAISSA